LPLEAERQLRLTRLVEDGERPIGLLVEQMDDGEVGGDLDRKSVV
jgi:hypothetical protein